MLTMKLGASIARAEEVTVPVTLLERWSLKGGGDISGKNSRNDNSGDGLKSVADMMMET